MFRTQFIQTVLLCVGLIAGILHSQTSIAPSGGDGSSGNPYQIATLENLYWIAEDSSRWDKSYFQIANINASETKNWFNGTGWRPIGNYNSRFSGIYNGKGHLIDSLYISFRVVSYSGLFGYTSSSRIDSLGLADLFVIGANYIGGLVGLNDSSCTISNCFCTGEIRGSSDVGGLVGKNNGLISNCYSTVRVIGSSTDIGGLVGTNGAGISKINNCFSTSNVKGYCNVGGLVGSSEYKSTISNCYSTGSVNDSTSTKDFPYGTGGLVGYSGGCTISDCYSSGYINGFTNVGGLVGFNTGSRINNCYSTGTMKGSSEHIGGLVGYNYNMSTISNSFSNRKIQGSIYVGGLVGANDYWSTIDNCFSMGEITGDSIIGGLTGYNNYMSTIKNCYSTCHISNGSNCIGGLVGNNTNIVTSSFWDIQSSGLDTSSGGTGNMTTEMKSASIFITAGWDFIGEITNGIDNFWGINSTDNSGYPFLKWQNFRNDPAAINLKLEKNSNLKLKKAGSYLFSKTGTIRLVNLSGKLISESRHVNEIHSLNLIRLPTGIFIARSGKESLCIVNE